MSKSLKTHAFGPRVVVSACILLLWIPYIDGHGRLVEPPSRSSMWRFGFSTPHNYNDNQLNCGGFSNQWDTNGGKCGVCGDSYQGPRENEAGGKYANGIITRHYKEGATIDVRVDITASHKGWYEFRLCKKDTADDVPITHDCLDKHLLEIEGHATRYFLKSTVPIISHLRVVLRSGVTCTHCVLQWKWNCGNNWGTDPDGTSGPGHGPQEQFYGCADIAIEPHDTAKTALTPSDQHLTTPETTFTTSGITQSITEVGLNPEVTTRSEVGLTTHTEDTTTTADSRSGCHARRWFQRTGGDAWCVVNCNAGFCPSSHCICGTATEPEDCKPTGSFQRVPGSANWCASNCALGFCPRTHCACPAP